MKQRFGIMMFFVAFVVFFSATPQSSQAYTQTANRIDYYAGNIPVIISVPHGGTQDGGLEPYDPYYCHGGVPDPDPRTIELALKIQAAFGARFKKANGETAKPYIVINNWKRKYLDANRDPGYNNRETVLYDRDLVNPGNTQDQDITINPYDCLAYISTGSRNVWAALACKKAWYSYNDFIDQAKREILNQYANHQILYIDLHSQMHSSDIFELGYFVKAEQFQGTLPDKSLTSLRRLTSAYSLDKLLIGDTDNPSSFGGIFEKLLRDDNTSNSSVKYEGLTNECTPSPLNPEPPVGEAPTAKPTITPEAGILSITPLWTDG